MTDISALLERLKNNKLVLPAIAVGVVGGGYLLLKGGGIGGGGITAQDTASPTPADGQNSAPGSPAGDTSGQSDAAIAALQQQQQSFQSSLVDQFNALVSSVQGALGGQQSQTQAAIDAIGQQVQAQANLQGQQPALSMGNMPDFGQLFSAINSIPAQLQASYQSPNIALNQSSLGGSLLSRVSESRRMSITPRVIQRTIPTQYPRLMPPISRQNLPGARLPSIIPPRVTVIGHTASSNKSGNRLVG